MIASDVSYRRAVGVPSRTVSDRVLIARPGRDDFDALTGPAVAVWNLLQEPRTLEDLVEVLAWAYQAPRERIEADVRGLLSELLDLGAIREG